MSFNFSASGVYILNDLLDLKNDRQHPNKKNRPFASSAIKLQYGIIIAPILFIVSFVIALSINFNFFLLIISYFLLTTLYSFYLKRLQIIDCLILAIFYDMRIIAGTLALNIELSYWLISFSTLFFLSLAFVKRFSEIKLQKKYGNLTTPGRNYKLSDLKNTKIFGITSGYASVIIFCFYLNAQKIAKLYQSPKLIWLAVPLLFFWINWVWIKANKGKVHEDPIIFAIKDAISLFSAFLLLFIFLLAKNFTIF